LFGRPCSPQRINEFCREWSAREATLAAVPRQQSEHRFAADDDEVASA
jgi:hypothetical protein